MRNELNPMVQFALAELEKKRKQSEFDKEFYVDVATGKTKKRLYVNQKPRPRNFGEPKEQDDEQSD